MLLVIAPMMLFVSPAKAQNNFDVVVYGGTPAAIMAAVAAASHGRSVVLLDLNNHEGGVVSGGLIYTDMGDRTTVGGLANSFFNRVASYYTTTYGANSTQAVACKSGQKFEPHVAEMIFDQMLAEQNVTVVKNVRLDLTVPGSVTQDVGGNITSMTVQSTVQGSAQTFTGSMFIDASYEGDLMAGSHTTYTYGREAQSQYGESLAGIQVPGPEFGQADNLIMSYDYRPDITNDPANHALFAKPANYDPAPFAAHFAPLLKNGSITQFQQAFGFTSSSFACPNTKYCTNTFDFAGSSDGYADGTWATRDAIAEALKEYAQSCFYYLQHDTASIAPAFYQDAQNWGLPQDEFTDTGGFPFQLYIREARRMVGQYILTQSDVTQNRYKPDGICSPTWGIDCHIIQQLTIDGNSFSDATPSMGVPYYDIPYACLTPSTASGQPGNLLVPVCSSASHVAYDSLRLEPVYMMLGQAAGDAAHLALSSDVPVQQVNVTALRTLLKADGAVLDAGYIPSFKISYSPAHPIVGETVRFNLTATSHPLSGYIDYWWDFEGAGVVGSQIHSPTYTFNQNKIYNVSLIIQDAAGRRSMVTCPVPVGTAAAQDVTIDDFDSSVTYLGSWTAGYPVISISPRIVEVFTGPSTHYSVADKSATAQAIYQPSHLAPGLYQVCLGYRPAHSQSSSALVTVNASGTSTSIVVNEQAAVTSPFPFLSLGTYRFSGNGAETVAISTTGIPTSKIATDAMRWIWKGN